MPDYPPPLENIPDPPSLLYVQGATRAARPARHRGGRLAALHAVRRRGSPSGCAAALARTGFTVVSGLARGIDAAAHRGAIKAGGRTIAVLANGLASVYPPEHEELARAVVAAGSLGQRDADAARSAGRIVHPANRIISGLSLGVVVVEATPRSGSLSTAGTPWNRIARSSPSPGPPTASPAAAAIA